jgi:hypothetical protein
MAPGISRLRWVARDRARASTILRMVSLPRAGKIASRSHTPESKKSSAPKTNAPSFFSEPTLRPNSRISTAEKLHYHHKPLFVGLKHRIEIARRLGRLVFRDQRHNHPGLEPVQLIGLTIDHQRAASTQPVSASASMKPCWRSGVQPSRRSCRRGTGVKAGSSPCTTGRRAVRGT